MKSSKKTLGTTDQASPSSVEEVPEKLTLRLPSSTRLALEWIAAKKGVTLGEAIRHAITTEKFLMEEIERGSLVLIEEKNGARLKQLIFQ